MKLLIITQVIDKNHPVLGFFHRWVEEFAAHCEQVTVICLQAGVYDLPKNVHVYSLGKEEGKSHLVYLYRFYTYLWTLRHEYDQVFVHMNQIYVILGAPVWRTLGKNVGLWYAHGAVSSSLKLSLKLSNFVFTSTKEGLRINSPKRIIVGQGIDFEIFKSIQKKDNVVLQLITVGRISQSKNVETLLRACSLLKEKHIIFQFKIVGIPTTDSEVLYAKEMYQLSQKLNLQKEVEWVGAIPNYDLPRLLQQSDVFIHDGSTNSLDKALVEAVLCGCIVLSSNPSYKALTKDIASNYLYNQGDSAKLTDILVNLKRNSVEYEAVRNRFSNNFSIVRLISAIVSKYQAVPYD